MNVEIIAATPNPIDVISIAAGCSYGKAEPSEKRMEHCFNNGHMSVFEHASATFRITGISRACCDQLTRHRLCSFVVQSQRYTGPEGDWYVTPESICDMYIAKDYWPMAEFSDAIERAIKTYRALIDFGVKKEDARFVLPMATKTNVVMTANVRQLFHIFDMRLDKAAQWEIRKLFQEIADAVAAVDTQWGRLIELYNEGRKND